MRRVVIPRLNFRSGRKGDVPAGMVLPPEYIKYPDTAVWIEGKKSCKSDWKNYVQNVVTLL